MKKIISLIICFCALVSFSVTGFAAEDIKITLNEEEIFSDVKPFEEDEITMLPARAVLEAMGAQVNWDNDNRTVLTVYRNEEDFTSIVLQIGLEYAFLNSEAVELEKPAEIVNNRTFVPLSFLTTVFQGKISWDELSKTVVIATNEE